MSVNLEPIYAIVLAAILFGEQQELSGKFYAGVAIILGVVFAQGLLAGRRKPAAPSRTGRRQRKPPHRRLNGAVRLAAPAMAG